MKTIEQISLTERDQKVLWHPYTQAKTAAPPIAITHGEGSYVYDEDGNRYIDAISSWWVNLHGHSHPYMIRSVLDQMTRLEHVLFAGFTHEPAVLLAEKLLSVLPRNQQRVFYSDDGSTAVEVGIKMAIQYWANSEMPRTKILALKNSYHGDTFGTMSLSHRGAFNEPFSPFLFEVEFIEVPKTQKDISHIESILSENYAAFIFEPLVQGTAGMKMYEANLLNQLLLACHRHRIITIADEVMTGFGRTGKLFAMDYIIEKPDIICLSKGLTGGMMPLGVTTCSERIYEAFYVDDKYKCFFHGHSYTANPLACRAGLASLELLLRRGTQEAIARIEWQHADFVQKIKTHPKVRSARCLGTILAVEWRLQGGGDYFSEIRDQLYSFFIGEGILIRPLGPVVYLMPPYCISTEDLDFIYDRMVEALEKF